MYYIVPYPMSPIVPTVSTSLGLPDPGSNQDAPTLLLGRALDSPVPEQPQPFLFFLTETCLNGQGQLSCRVTHTVDLSHVSLTRESDNIFAINSSHVVLCPF